MAGPVEHIKNARPVIFGEVLFDQFPDGSVILGGAPFNVAWHLHAFGLAPLMISRIGNDPLGREIRETMQSWGMDCTGLQLDSRHPTGTVAVTFLDNEPKFEIVADRAYDFIDAQIIPSIDGNSVIYHGSLSLRNEVSRKALQQLKKLTGAPCFVDINLRPPWWTESVLNLILHEAYWLKLNERELEVITPGLTNLEDRMEYLMHKFPAQYLVVTRGGDGAVVIDRAGGIHYASPCNNLTIVDTVGAGDAFSSVILLGQIKSWPEAESLQRAQFFANAIVGVRGATVSNRKFYQPFIDSWQLG